MASLQDFIEEIIVYQDGSKLYIQGHFPKVTVIANNVLESVDNLERDGDLLRMWFANGHATYRLIEEQPSQQRSLWMRV